MCWFISIDPIMRVMAEILMSISLFHTVLCMDIPPPVNLNISSQYFLHLLTWRMGAGTPDGVHYTVSIRTLSDSKRVMVKGCEKVTSPLQCDLTRAFPDVEETYYTSVSAGLENRTSPPAHCKPFKPILNTVLESPLVSVTVCNTSLCVSLRSPSPELHSIYNSSRFDYRLVISNEDGHEIHRDIEGLQNVTVNDLTHGRRYCVNVSIINRTKSFSRPAVCAFIPKTLNISEAVFAGIVCLLIVMFVVCVIQRLLSHCLKVDQPAVLSSFEILKVKVLLIAPEPINNLTEVKDSIQKMKKSREEDEETDGETEEGVTYERLATQHLKVQDTSPHSVLPESSGSLKMRTSGIHASLSSFTDVRHLYDGGHVNETELTASRHLLEDTRSLLKREERRVPEDEDVNLCSVMIPAVMMKECEADRDELMTDSSYEKHTSVRCSSASVDHNIHMSDCEQESQDEDSGYLSRA